MSPSLPPTPSVAGQRDLALEVGGDVWSYRDVGAGDVVLVLDPTVVEDETIETLATRYRLISPALTGLDEGDGTGRPRQVAARLALMTRALGLTRYAVVSRGATSAVALWLAAGHPESVSAIILESPLMGGGPAAEDAADLFDTMAGLEVPTLILLGLGTEASSPEQAGRYKRLPASTVALVYAAGEDIRGERPAAYLAAVTDYLERGQAFVVSNQSTVIHA